MFFFEISRGAVSHIQDDMGWTVLYTAYNPLTTV